MTDLRQLREIEKLVQDSVFHPSPCNRLRERVLQHAVQAKQRQKLWQRFVVASSAIMGILLLAFLITRNSTPKPTAATETGPVRVQIYSPGHTASVPAAPQAAAASGSSLGEDLYFRSTGLQHGGSPNTAVPAVASGHSNSSTSKDLAGNNE